jgi:hypothetical protein
MRVTFRGSFQRRKGLLQTNGFTFKNPPVETVEVFRKGAKWFAREARSKNLYPLPDGATHGTMKDTVADSFDKQVEPWRMFDLEGNQIDPDSVIETPEGDFSAKPDFSVPVIGGLHGY